LVTIYIMHVWDLLNVNSSEILAEEGARRIWGECSKGPRLKVEESTQHLKAGMNNEG
jgi:hypothetical protein